MTTNEVTTEEGQLATDPALTPDQRATIMAAVYEYSRTARLHERAAAENDEGGATARAALHDAAADNLRHVLAILPADTRLAHTLAGVRIERDTVRRELEQSMAATQAAITSAAEQRETLYGAVTRAQQQLAEFKARVVDVADEYARQHDWCSVIDDALRELGLEREPKGYKAQLTITVEIQATFPSRRSLPDEGWVLGSIDNKDVVNRAIRELRFDSDHAGGTFTDIEYEVSNVEELED